MNQETFSLKVKLAVVFTIVVWASAFVGIRAGLSVYAPGELALLRYLVASLFMAGCYLCLPNKTKPNCRDVGLFLLLGATGFALYNVALGYGETYLTAGEAGFIVATNPMVTAIFAVIFLRERMAAIAWLGVFISLLGVALIAYAEVSAFQFNRGIIYSFMATLCFSIYCVVQKPLLERYSSLELVVFSIWAGTLLLLPYFPNMIIEMKKAPMSLTLWIIYLGIFPGGLAYFTWSYALKYGAVTKVVSSIYVAPFVITLMGWLILGEVPPGLALVGGCVAVLGALIVYVIKDK